MTALNKTLLAGAAIGAGLLLRSSNRPGYTFRKKSVLITGGSRGLGLELARLFAAEGANISLVARTPVTLEAAKTELEKLGARVLAIPCDVRDRDQVEAAIRAVIVHFGGLDVLVNNAGVIQVGPFDRMKLEDYQNSMATHAWGALYAIFGALPHMRGRGAGRIINISSIGGKLGVPHLLPYSMSKFALAGLSEGLASEVARYGIFVTSVYPGLMRTGSHVNAMFKGQHRREFAWFSLAAGSPLLSMDARRAARQIVEASRRGQAELILTPQARLATVAKTLVPGMVALALQATAAMLPRPGRESSDESHSGWESRSLWSPSPLTLLADRAVKRNNEAIPSR